MAVGVEIRMAKYHTVSVEYEHTVDGSDQRNFNRAVLTVYGESEFAVQAELERQYPSYDNIVLLDVEWR